jgi:hypothetical protein
VSIDTALFCIKSELNGQPNPQYLRYLEQVEKLCSGLVQRDFVMLEELQTKSRDFFGIQLGSPEVMSEGKSVS